MPASQNGTARQKAAYYRAQAARDRAEGNLNDARACDDEAQKWEDAALRLEAMSQNAHTPTPPTTENFLSDLQTRRYSRDVVPTYAGLILATTGDNTDHGINVAEVNAYLLKRFAHSTFKRIKQAAWKIADREVPEAKRRTS